MARYVKKYPFENCKYVRSFCGLYGDKETYKRELFGKGCLHEFEGGLYPIPLQYNIYLTQMYGDYMKLPPIEKQVTNHANEVIDLHKGYREHLDDGAKQ